MSNDTKPGPGWQWSPYNRPGGTPAPSAGNQPRPAAPTWHYGPAATTAGPVFERPQGYQWQVRPDKRNVEEYYAWLAWRDELVKECLQDAEGRALVEDRVRDTLVQEGVVADCRPRTSVGEAITATYAAHDRTPPWAGLHRRVALAADLAIREAWERIRQEYAAEEVGHVSE